MKNERCQRGEHALLMLAVEHFTNVTSCQMLNYPNTQVMFLTGNLRCQPAQQIDRRRNQGLQGFGLSNLDPEFQ